MLSTDWRDLEYAVLRETRMLLVGHQVLARLRLEQTNWGLKSTPLSQKRGNLLSWDAPPRHHLELCLFHLHELPSCIRLAYIPCAVL